eukprot:300571-Chlamydomonas_euryale.AAC.18
MPQPRLLTSSAGFTFRTSAWLSLWGRGHACEGKAPLLCRLALGGLLFLKGQLHAELRAG